VFLILKVCEFPAGVQAANPITSFRLRGIYLLNRNHIKVKKRKRKKILFIYSTVYTVNIVKENSSVKYFELYLSYKTINWTPDKECKNSLIYSTVKLQIRKLKFRRLTRKKTSQFPLLELSAWYSKKTLKGQCHEIVAKMSPWSSSLGLN
jgi:hypothetical protein